MNRKNCWTGGYYVWFWYMHWTLWTTSRHIAHQWRWKINSQVTLLFCFNSRPLPFEHTESLPCGLDSTSGLQAEGKAGRIPPGFKGNNVRKYPSIIASKLQVSATFGIYNKKMMIPSHVHVYLWIQSFMITLPDICLLCNYEDWDTQPASSWYTWKEHSKQDQSEWAW